MSHANVTCGIQYVTCHVHVICECHVGDCRNSHANLHVTTTCECHMSLVNVLRDATCDLCMSHVHVTCHM